MASSAIALFMAACLSACVPGGNSDGSAAAGGANAAGPTWTKAFGGSSDDRFEAVSGPIGSGFVAAGSTDSTDGDISESKGMLDAIVARIDPNGKLIWLKTFGGSGDDGFCSVVTMRGGEGIVAVGYSESHDGDITDDRGHSDAVIVKYDSNGNVVWHKTFGGGDDDEFDSVDQTADGNFIVVGASQSTDGDILGAKGGRDAIIAKYDADGNLLWAKTFGGSSDDGLNSVAATADGGFVAAGAVDSTNGDVQGGRGESDAVIAKYDADGNLLWAKTFGGSEVDEFSAVAEDADGNLELVGYTFSNDGDIQDARGDQDAVIAKYSSDGNLLWAKTFGGSGSDWFASLTQASDTGLVAVGSVDSSDGDAQGNNGGSDAVVAKYDLDGNLLWSNSLGGSDEDQFTSICQTEAVGRLAAAGSFASDDCDVDGYKEGVDAIAAIFGDDGI
ncbi:MAG: hypothetical protein FWF71_02960 [Actinomycetia bacterium]|nr:hypothetical protein [Actinomycetes bacterium]